MDLNGLKVVVGVTGGIAAYKTCALVSRLRRTGADVRVVMTQHATEFVSPLTFETLSNNRVVSDMFDRDREWEVEHVSIAAGADLFVVAPATANFLAKYATGVADDFLTTTAMSVKCPVLVCPAMNFRMLHSPATENNLRTLEARGVKFLYGAEGELACGERGDGRMAEPTEIFDAICDMTGRARDYEGKRVLITAGGTYEDIDGVRCLTNYSSGKMGAALANAAKRRGATVIYVEAHATAHPLFVDEQVSVNSTLDMYDAVLSRADDVDIVIKAAAPGDYRVERPAENKIKGDRVMLELVKNPDIAAAFGAKKRADQRLVVFCAETQDLLASARKKRIAKNADMVVANDVKEEGAGFNKDTNVVTVVTGQGETHIPKTTKTEIAERILDLLHDC